MYMLCGVFVLSLLIGVFDVVVLCFVFLVCVCVCIYFSMCVCWWVLFNAYLFRVVFVLCVLTVCRCL